MGRRVLITGLGTFWGGRMAQALEQDPDVEMIVGLDTVTPTVALERTEYVRADQSYSILSRIVRATQVDTIVHTFLVVDSTRMSGRALHETNVIGTMNLLAAASAAGSAGAPDRGQVLQPGVRVLVPGPGVVPRGDASHGAAADAGSSRSLLEAEGYLRDFAEDNPHVVVTLLRFANVLGTDIVTATSQALERQTAPYVFGFDPLIQFVEEGDVVRCLEFVTRHGVAGIYNVAGDGRLPWSEVASICGVRLLPLPSGPDQRRRRSAPPAGPARPALRSCSTCSASGGASTTAGSRTAGFTYRYTSAGAVENFARARRLRRTVGATPPEYTYERDVEAFFRHSPAVVRNPEA